jgi:hypothetical protein
MVKNTLENKNLFVSIIERLRKDADISSKAYALGIDLLSYSPCSGEAVRSAFKLCFNDVQNDVIDWWLYDSPSGIQGFEKKWAHIFVDGVIKYRLYSIEDLWDYIMELGNEETPD